MITLSLKKINDAEQFRYQVEKDNNEKYSARITLDGVFSYYRFDFISYDAAVAWLLETYEREGRENEKN